MEIATSSVAEQRVCFDEWSERTAAGRREVIGILPEVVAAPRKGSAVTPKPIRVLTENVIHHGDVALGNHAGPIADQRARLDSRGGQRASHGTPENKRGVGASVQDTPSDCRTGIERTNHAVAAPAVRGKDAILQQRVPRIQVRRLRSNIRPVALEVASTIAATAIDRTAPVDRAIAEEDTGGGFDRPRDRPPGLVGAVAAEGAATHDDWICGID